MATALALAIIAVLAVLFVIMIVSSLIVICPPNKVAVISGRTRTLSDGRTVGYRILKGGRTLRSRSGEGLPDGSQHDPA